MLYVRGVPRPRRRGVRPRPAHGRGDVVFAFYSSRHSRRPGRRAGTPARPSRGRGRGGRTHRTAWKAPSTQASGPPAARRGRARLGALRRCSLRRRVAGRCGSRRLITPGLVRAPVNPQIGQLIANTKSKQTEESTASPAAIELLKN